MKKKLISVLALVLVLCFVWVAEVDAVNIISISLEEANYIFSNAYWSNNTMLSTFYNSKINISNTDYSFLYTRNVNNSSIFKFFNMTDIFSSGDTVNLKFLIIVLDYGSSSSGVSYSLNDLVSAFSFSIGYANLADLTDLSISYSFDTVTLEVDNLSAVYDCVVVDVSYLSQGFDYLRTQFKLGGSAGYWVVDSFMFGLVCEPVNYGLTNEEKQILQRILLGVDSANQQLDDMQSEQSSYYEEMITPDESNLNAAESMSVALESGKEIVDEYSSLNDSLEKPSVDQLLPDYDRVVDGYVDTSIFDVFSTLYESGYIMFILLITCFFGVMSYALFGKKA